jgi:2,3-bisphosphoglycerate-dependent phosphoglycerate mutase
MPVTTVYLVRHAHADFSDDENRPLSAAGLQSAQTLAERLSDRPIAAVYSSSHRRSIDTVAPLAARRGVRVELLPDLRERELPVVPAEQFHQLVERAWTAPDARIDGGESNAAAQARGIAVIRNVITQHQGQHVVIGTHGNLLALILNGFDPAFGYDFWRSLSFPDVYQLEFAYSGSGLEFAPWGSGLEFAHLGSGLEFAHLGSGLEFERGALIAVQRVWNTT